MGKSGITAYVHGVAVLSGWADGAMSLEEFIFAGVTAALTDADVAMAQIDSVVLAAHDLVDGRSLSSMVTAPAAGAYFRDEIRLSEDGLSALSLAAARVEAAESAFSVVAAWGRASEGDYRSVSRRSFDPFNVQPFSLDDLSASSMRAFSWMSRHGEIGMAARSARQQRAARNPRCFAGHTRCLALGSPFVAQDEPHLNDVMVAAIIGKAPTAIAITGVGHGTDHWALGDRDLLAMMPLVQAVQAAGAANRFFDLYELDGATLVDEVLAFEALELAPPGTGPAAYAREERLNPSGGSAAGWSFPTNGLRRFAEACLQMRGAAGGVQLPTRPRSALVSGYSPCGAQVATAVTLEAR